MGSACCKTDHSDRIDEGLGKDKAADREIKKLLLLGAGSSGKSTFFKQLKRIHGNGFTTKDRRDYAAQIENQIISQMQKLIIRGRELIEDYGVEKYGSLSIQSGDAIESGAFIELLSSQTELTEEIGGHIQNLWNDAGIQATWNLRGQLSIPDSCSYFFDDIGRICLPQYSPSDEDILLVRKRTTGIIEEHFLIKNTKFNIFDVGGQRNERKKWIHCFDSVTAVIFVASLSSYNEVLLEDENVIVMKEEMNLFDQICNSRWFEETAFILFLNKRDLFEEKYKTNGISLKSCFEDYTGDPSYDSVEEPMAFIKKKYLERNNNTSKQIYSHFTCATDRDNVFNLFNDVQQVVIQTSLKVGGLI
eukprot:80268_1